MRIGLLAPPWVPVPPPSYGGTEAVIDRLARGLMAAGHDVLLYATADSTSPVPCVPHPRDARPDDMGSLAVELAHVIEGHAALAGCDVIHDHTLAGPLVGTRDPGAPIVTTAHGPFDENLAALYREMAQRVPIIAISHDQARTARDIGIEVTRVIHHGIDPEAVPQGDGDGGYLLSLGRMTPDKGADTAIEVARRAGLPLKIAAKMREPAEHQFFAEVVEPHLDGQIEYVGEPDSEGVVRLLQGAIALVNPIRWSEPFGLAMVEALAAGTPVVTFPNGSAPEIVEDGVTGFLCEDVGQMADRLAQVHTLDRDACRRAVETKFSTARMVADHVALYEELVAGVRTPRQRQEPASVRQ